MTLLQEIKTETCVPAHKRLIPRSMIQNSMTNTLNQVECDSTAHQVQWKIVAQYYETIEVKHVHR